MLEFHMKILVSLKGNTYSPRLRGLESRTRDSPKMPQLRDLEYCQTNFNLKSHPRDSTEVFPERLSLKSHLRDSVEV